MEAQPAETDPEAAADAPAPAGGEDTTSAAPAETAPAETESDKPEQAEQTKQAEQAEQAEPEDMETVMARHLAKAYRKLVKRHEKAVVNWDNEELSLHEREDYFHDMRKAAKKLRYAAEAAGSATKLKTKRLYKACKQMQSVLGDFQDSVTSRDKLLELAQAARSRGEVTFGYGLLYQRERQIGLEALEDYSESFDQIKAAFKPLKKKLK